MRTFAVHNRVVAPLTAAGCCSWSVVVPHLITSRSVAISSSVDATTLPSIGPSPLSLDRRAHTLSRAAYDKWNNAGPVLTTATEAAAQHGERRQLIGCSWQQTLCGVVSNVQRGKLLGGVDVLQFTISTRVYRHRAPGALRLTQNELTVRARGPWLPYRIPEGSRVTIRGTLSTHVTYDLVAKSVVENVVIDVSAAGFLGILPDS